MSAAEEFDPNVLTREERIAALKAGHKRWRVAELAAFFAKDDEDTDESHEMGEVVEFDDDGGGL